MDVGNGLDAPTKAAFPTPEASHQVASVSTEERGRPLECPIPNEFDPGGIASSHEMKNWADPVY